MVAALVLSLSLLQLVNTQVPPQQQQTSPQMGTPKPLADEKAEKGSLEGRVTSAVDGQPLQKTIVTLMPQQQPGVISRPLVTISDADGKYIFREVDAARYTLNFSRNGFARTNYGARVPNGAWGNDFPSRRPAPEGHQCAADRSSGPERPHPRRGQ